LWYVLIFLIENKCLIFKDDRANYKSPFQSEQEDVIILFCYIADFPQLVRAQKENIFCILHTLYICIDKLCEKHGIQKVEVNCTMF